MFFMLPKFMEMFKGFNIELPLPTRMLMAFSYAVTSVYAILGTVAGLAAADW